jgi:hypothetical protein
MEELQITLIHNFSRNRTESALNEIGKFRSNLKFVGLPGTTTIGWQPPINPVSYLALIRKELETFKYLRRWNKYLGRSVSLFDRSNPILVGMTRALGILRNVQEKRYKCAIEIELSLKHARAWEAFLELDAGWLMILEDDIILASDASNSVTTFENLLGNNARESAFFISISNPYSIEQLKIEKLVRSGHERFIELKKPCTNTTAGYVISRKAAEVLAISFRRDQALRYLSADLMLNEIFARNEFLPNRFASWHVVPQIFENGTIEGKIKSSIS